MIGKYQIQLGADQFVSGMASSDYATDGALGVSSINLNPFVAPGLMSGLATGSDISASVLGNIIASAEDSQTVSAYNRTFIDASGNYYTYTAPGTVTKTNTATTNVAQYVLSKTDMVSFALNTYVTTANGDIDRWNTTPTPTLTNSWWVGTKGQAAMSTIAPHPMVVYQGFNYIADLNKLNTVDSSDTIALAVLTLNPNEVIHALGIDPVTGLMMLSVQTTINLSDTLSSRYFVYLYDGISSKPTRKIPVDDLITAFHNVEGQVYTGQGITLGAWNGNGVTFLRKLKNAAYNSSDLIYKHRITNTRNILHVVDGATVLSYGAAVAGKKGFFYTATNGGGGHLTAIFPMGSATFAIAYSSAKLILYDLESTTSPTLNLTFNNIYFPRPVFIRRVKILTTGTPQTGDNGNGSLLIYDENNVSHFVRYVTATSFTPGFFVPTGRTFYNFNFDFSSLKLQGASIQVNTSSSAYAIVRVIIYYDIAE